MSSPVSSLRQNLTWGSDVAPAFWLMLAAACSFAASLAMYRRAEAPRA